MTLTDYVKWHPKNFPKEDVFLVESKYYEKSQSYAKIRNSRKMFHGVPLVKVEMNVFSKPLLPKTVRSVFYASFKSKVKKRKYEGYLSSDEEETPQLLYTQKKEEDKADIAPQTFNFDQKEFYQEYQPPQHGYLQFEETYQTIHEVITFFFYFLIFNF